MLIKYIIVHNILNNNTQTTLFSGDFNSLKRKRVERQSDFGPKTRIYNLGTENSAYFIKT